MKKVEERDGKVFIDGVEYEQVKSRVSIYGVPLSEIKDILHALGEESVELHYSEHFSGIDGKYKGFSRTAIMINTQKAQALSRLIHNSLKKLEEEQKQFTSYWNDFVSWK